MLTPRQRQVMALIAEGRSNQAICDELVIAPKTLERHIFHIYRQLGLPNEPDVHRRVSAVLMHRNRPVA